MSETRVRFIFLSHTTFLHSFIDDVVRKADSYYGYDHHYDDEQEPEQAKCCWVQIHTGGAL